MLHEEKWNDKDDKKVIKEELIRERQPIGRR